MNAVAANASAGRGVRAAATAPPAPRLALLGTGTVGGAFVARCERLRGEGVDVPAFAWLANSRAMRGGGGRPLDALAGLRAAPGTPAERSPVAGCDGLRRGDVLVDATASDRVAARHGEWLARGINVVTANKLGRGADLARAEAIAAAQAGGGARYGNSATVGAGLPLLHAITGLRAGGDRIHAVEGVLSGTLAWLFGGYDGTRPFSALLRDARGRGLCEPDPRVDLSGQDVRRKLLILARAAGLPLEAHHVRVESLLDDTLAAAGAGDAERLFARLDAPLRRHLLDAQRSGRKLCFTGRFDAGGAEVGLRSLPASHPLCTGNGTDNLVAISSCRYATQPLLIRGPGAGAGVTAAALLDDVLGIVRSESRASGRSGAARALSTR
ncbi:homoserine dehydrogenase [Luteimonas sp. MJ174]|uniref:homoserine dehydrogenase n=1 Tax=Luteimonas sp. MJ174 TaxID=3129237 RepID=UPI0031BB6CFA